MTTIHVVAFCLQKIHASYQIYPGMSEDHLSHFLPISLRNSNSPLRCSLTSTSSLSGASLCRNVLYLSFDQSSYKFSFWYNNTFQKQFLNFCTQS